MELTAPREARRSWPRRLLTRLRHTECGQALVEFTLVLPLFLILLFAIVDFGRGFYTWLIVTNAAREGARVAATQQPVAAVQTRIYDSFCTNYPTNCSLTPGKLTWTNQGSANVQGPRGEAVTIQLSYDFDYATPIGGILNLVTGGTLAEPTITANSSMRLE